MLPLTPEQQLQKLMTRESVSLESGGTLGIALVSVQRLLLLKGFVLMNKPCNLCRLLYYDKSTSRAIYLGGK